MTLEKSAATTSGEWTGSHKPIVVAVDGSERNRSAVDWASGEAVDAGAKIVLVTAIDDFVIPIPHFSVRSEDGQVRDMLAAVRNEVQHVVTDQEVVTEVVAGAPVDVLLDRSKDSRMVVVGKRGLGGFARVLVGSTSIALAGRAKVPVAIVPDDWRHEEHRSDPVVVGIDPYRAEHRPIQLAFHRARRLGVKLIAVHGWETPAMYDWDSAVVSGAAAQWEQDAHASSTRCSTAGASVAPTSWSRPCTRTVTRPWPCSTRPSTHSW